MNLIEVVKMVALAVLIIWLCVPPAIMGLAAFSMWMDYNRELEDHLRDREEDRER